ncbi:MAG: hypothetical protein D3903_10645, partial [Candidatus Electrothrix sp. GM3_4]|nr:hypothetical protein [Candidatus Electrothrix sp. GM3_4]
MSNAQRSLEEETDPAEKYHQLQAAHYQLEDDHIALQHQLKRTRRRYRLLFLLLIIAGIGSSGYFWRGEISSFLPGVPGLEKQSDEPKEPLVTVKTQTLRNTLSLAGKIEPLGQIDVVAPLDGMVLKKNFQYGDFIEKDTILLTIDTGNEEVGYRDAQAAYLEAEDWLKSLKNWETSLEVVRIKHELAQIQQTMKTTRRELETARRLFKKGIVPSSEVEGLEEQYQNQQENVVYSKKRLAGTLEKGSEENVHRAELKRENALLKMKAVAARIAKAQLVSPIDGVILL